MEKQEEGERWGGERVICFHFLVFGRRIQDEQSTDKSHTQMVAEREREEINKG